VEGFSPELAVVTIGGGEEIAEPLILRPTFRNDYRVHVVEVDSILPRFARVDEPVEFRCALELRTKLFFAHAGILLAGRPHRARHSAGSRGRNAADAGTYTDFAVTMRAIPVIPGKKSDAEKFAGADITYSIEAMMGDGKALQAGTSHFLGQNFAQAFEVKYLDQGGQLQHCWTTSWGLETAPSLSSSLKIGTITLDRRQLRRRTNP